MNEAIQEIAVEEESESQGKRSYVARAYAAGSPTSGLTAATILRPSQARRTCKLKFSTVVCATQTCIRCATSGGG